MTWSALIADDRFPGCGHGRTPENTTTSGRCRECGRAYARHYNERLQERYGCGQSEAIARQAAEREIERLGVAGIHGDQFDRARQRTENRLARDARRRA